LLIIGDHTKHDKKFKYEYYEKEKSDFNKNRSNNKRKLIRLHSTKYKQIDYTVWLRSLNRDRIDYLKKIGIKNQKQLQTLSKMAFNILPYDIRSSLQTKVLVNRI